MPGIALFMFCILLRVLLILRRCNSVCVCVHVSVKLCMCVHVYTSGGMCVSMCTYACVFVWVCIHVDVCVQVWAHAAEGLYSREGGDVADQP